MSAVPHSRGTIQHLQTLVQVGKRIRDGGRYAVVSIVNRDGSLRPSTSPMPLIVKFPEENIGLVAPGTLWLIDGPEEVTSYSKGGDRRYERTIKATTAKFVKPTGQTLARWLKENINGIGDVLSNRLVRQKQLAKWVKNNDRDSLLAVHGMSPNTVDSLIENWPAEEVFEVIAFLDENGIPAGVGKSILKTLHENALNVLKGNPFLLLGLGVSFTTAAKFAEKMGFSRETPAFIAGVAAHVAFLHSEETGSTVIGATALHQQATELVKHDMPVNLGDIAVQHQLLVKCGESSYQVYGCALMEHEVADFLVKSICRQPGHGTDQASWELGIERKIVKDALQQYEENYLDFDLLPEQREVVIGSVLAPVCGISGGAGTGKTTILRAILGCYQLLSASLHAYQVALSGRAAQRMAECTGRTAQTIAKLIAEHLGDGKPELPSHLLLIVDEASMVDLLSMYRLVRLLPYAIRIIFVGDSMQLLPVGKGLVFHALKDSGVRFFELKQVMRQDEQSGIHRFAMDIRNGIVSFPQAATNRLADCADCTLDESNDPDRLANLWLQAGGINGGIVLCPTRKGSLGVDNTNIVLQKKVGLDRPPLMYKDAERGWMPWITSDGMRLLRGDPLLVVENNYDTEADLRNGDLVILEDVFKALQDDHCFGRIRTSDGRLIEVDLYLLSKLRLGYAVTIHKSQGSQWPTCFITLPKQAAGMIDQSLLYTAVTRAQDRVLLFGERSLIIRAIARGPASLERVTTLARRIQHLTNLATNQSEA